MKRPILIFTVVYIIAIAGAQYLNISICAPFNYEKIYSTVSNCQIIGIITEEGKETEKNYKYTVKVEKLYSNGNLIKQLKGTKILVKVEKNEKVAQNAKGEKNEKSEKGEKLERNEKDVKNEKKLKVGNEIEFNCCIEIPDGQRNYGGSDYKLYLKTLGIYAVSEITEKDYKILNNNKFSIVDTGVNIIKTKITNNINNLLSDDTKGISLGILLGDTRYISDEIKSNFENSNLLHMLAVSGSHVTYILVGVEKCLKKVNKRFQKIVLILFLIFFMKITGATSSVVRAGIMGILILWSWLFRRKSDVLNNMAISSLIITIINPYSIYNLGFQLSYAGTLGIVFYYDIVYKFLNDKVKIVYEKIIYKKIIYEKIILYGKVLWNKLPIVKKLLEYIITTISVCIAANILIMPLLVYHTNKISFVFLISNLLASCLFGIILLFSFLVSITSFISLNLSKLLVPFLELSIKLVNYESALSAKLAVYDILVPTPSLITLIFIYFIIFLLKNNIIAKDKCKKIAKNTIVIYISISIIFYAFQNSKKELKLYFIDVGQGDSTLIITQQHKKILIDGGGSNTDFDVGEETLLPYLLDRKIKTLDYVIISHFDSDHCKGIFTVLNKLKVRNVCVSSIGQESDNFNEFLDIVKQKKLHVIYVKSGDKIKIDKYTYIDILWTGDKSISENIINNYSITFKLIYNQYQILFTGDIEAIAEKKIIELYNKQDLKSDIIKIAHHGSKSSSTDEFISKVSPKIALIGVGKNNLFGHPNEGVINRLIQHGIQVFRTDEDTEVEIIIKNKIIIKN